jgi:hypothetical protein
MQAVQEGKVKIELPRWKRVAQVMISDLGLLLSLYMARYIVWHTLRDRRQEHEARRRNLRLIGRGNSSPDDNQSALPVGLDERGILHGTVRGQLALSLVRSHTHNHSGE